MDDQCKYNTYTCFIYNQLWFIDHPKNTLSYSINHELIKSCISHCSFQFQYFTISNQFKYAHKFNSVLPINSVMPLTNLTYVFNIQDIRVTGTVSLGCRPVSNDFITQYSPTRLLTGYKKSISEHYRYVPTGLLIRVTHQYNSLQYCYLTSIGIPIYP